MPRRAPAPNLRDDFLPPVLLGSVYGFHAITRVPADVRRTLNAHIQTVADPDADLSHLDEDTVQAIHEGRDAMKQVVGEALAYWNGMLDARHGTKDEKAPTERGGVKETQYLRGFIDGHLSEHAPKYSFQTHQASRSPERVPPAVDNALASALRQQADNAPAEDADRLSVHSAGTDIPMPDTPFLSMAALVGYDERDGSPTSFQRYVMDEAEYPRQSPQVDEARITGTLESDAAPAGRQNDPLAPRAFAPVPQGIPPRPARHLCPRTGAFLARAIPEVPLPEGVDRESIARDWDPDQRAALFDYDGEVAWMESEDKDHPADAYQLAEAFRALAAEVFPGETPPRPVIPFINAHGVRPRSIAVIGTPQQIDHLVTSGTWATSWLCAQLFPNRPRPLRFVCTFGGLNLGLKEHHKAKKMIRTALETSEEVAAFMTARGLILAPFLDTLEVQHLQLAGGGEASDLWNVVMTPPSEDAADQTVWRLTVAGLRPRDPFRGELVALPRPFKCRTCGCLTHPRRLCPTATTHGWTGTIPRWGVRKTLWGRRATIQSSAPVRIRDAMGRIVRAAGTKNRPSHKMTLVKKRKSSNAARNYTLGRYRRARAVPE